MAERRIGISKSMMIAQTLEREIRFGQKIKGDQLESEHALMDRFSASRNTVRKGLEKLTRDGLITTRSGIGSFVTYDGERVNNAIGWTLALSKTEGEIETRIVRIERAACPSTAKLLDIEEVNFLCVDRLRVIAESGVCLSLERSRLPWREDFDPVLSDGLLNDSLSATLSAAGLVVDNGEEWADVLLAISKSDARLMSREPGDAMLRLRRVTRTASGTVIEYVESIVDPQRFGLHLEF